MSVVKGLPSYMKRNFPFGLKPSFFSGQKYLLPGDILYVCCSEGCLLGLLLPGGAGLKSYLPAMPVLLPVDVV